MTHKTKDDGYGFLRSILRTIPTNTVRAASVTDPESLGNFLIALGGETQQIAADALHAEALAEERRKDIAQLRRQLGEEREFNDHLRGQIRNLKAEHVQLKLGCRTPDEVADQIWAETNGSRGIIPPIKEFRSVTGMGLRESKQAIEAARDRAMAVDVDRSHTHNRGGPEEAHG